MRPRASERIGCCTWFVCFRCYRCFRCYEYNIVTTDTYILSSLIITLLQAHLLIPLTQLRPYEVCELLRKGGAGIHAEGSMFWWNLSFCYYSSYYHFFLYEVLLHEVNTKILSLTWILGIKIFYLNRSTIIYLHRHSDTTACHWSRCPEHYHVRRRFS